MPGASGVIRTDKDSLWSHKRRQWGQWGQWSNPGGDEVEVGNWDLAMGMEHETYLLKFPLGSKYKA